MKSSFTIFIDLLQIQKNLYNWMFAKYIKSSFLSRLFLHASIDQFHCTQIARVDDSISFWASLGRTLDYLTLYYFKHTYLGATVLSLSSTRTDEML